MKNSLRQYLHDVRSAFPILQKSERRFLHDFELTLHEYQTIHPECSPLDLQNEFGAPKDVVIEYFNNMDSGSYLKAMRKSFYLKALSLSTIIFLSFGILIQAYFSYKAYREWQNTKITTEQTIITYN